MGYVVSCSNYLIAFCAGDQQTIQDIDQHLWWSTNGFWDEWMVAMAAGAAQNGGVQSENFQARSTQHIFTR
jgi:hypothetical protein